MIINKETKTVQTNSVFPNHNWMEIHEPGEWLLVPRELQDKAMEMSPYCDLVFDENEEGNKKLIDIVEADRPVMPEPERTPTIEERLFAVEEAIIAMAGVRSC